MKECPNCLGGGCSLCEVEPWPKETWLDLTDSDLEQLICDGLDELKRRAEIVRDLSVLFEIPSLQERWADYALPTDEEWSDAA